MQIDLMAPLLVDSVVQEGVHLLARLDGDVFFVRPEAAQDPNTRHELTVYYHGRPKVAVSPPWNGGIVWSQDPERNPWVATANQGIGARVWWPNKDHQSDEPDSLRIRVTVPSSMVEVSNGRLRRVERGDAGTTTYEWAVRNRINNYGITINAGNYVHFGESMDGEAGTLDLDYWVLEPHLAQARAQFAQVKPMLACFEGWLGPYPFYEDGYKLVEAPYLGMEHQSAIAYGNRFQNGYLGSDLSGTGRGLSWDYIIIHESAHEWFGNSITTADVADLWVHEGFADYAESLYVECTQGKAAGAEYVVGSRTRIRNDRPVIGPYGVHQEGSDDMYFKGANILHTLRQIVDDGRKVEEHAARHERRVQAWDRHVAGGGGVLRPSRRQRPGPLLRALSAEQAGSGPRILSRWRYGLVSVAGRGRWIRHACQGHRVAGSLSLDLAGDRHVEDAFPRA